MIHFTNKSCFLIGRNHKTPHPLLVASDKVGFGLDDFVFSLNTAANCMLFEMVQNEKCLFRATKDGEYGVGRKVTQTPGFSELINILQNYCVIDNSVYLPFLRWKTDNSKKLIF